MNVRLPRVILLLAVAATVGACSHPAGHDPWAAAHAYVKAHPVPPKPGMTAGIMMSQALLGAGCTEAPDTLTAAFVPARGGDPCNAWSLTIATASGRLTVMCGNPATGTPCPPAANGAGEPSGPGDYMYVPTDGQVTRLSDIQVIASDAVVP